LAKGVNAQVATALLRIITRESPKPKEAGMQRNLIAIALSLTFCTAVHAQEPAAVATQRDANQQERIEQGLQSGQLSSKEAGQLERDEQHLDSTQARDLKSGGALTP
jgi:hypothetical protein